jgi:hypothetical protein
MADDFSRDFATINGADGRRMWWENTVLRKIFFFVLVRQEPFEGATGS